MHRYYIKKLIATDAQMSFLDFIATDVQMLFLE